METKHSSSPIDVATSLLSSIYGVVKRENGCVFSTEDAIFVVKICLDKKYLQEPLVHFSDVSISQIQPEQKKIFFLFVTLNDNFLDYWLIPHALVSRLQDRRFIRIVKRNNRFMIKNVDVTQYYSQQLDC